MNRETIHPASEADWLLLRRNDLTSTDVAALFDASPYKSRFQLWHEKKGTIGDSFNGNERTTWGTRLQDAIAYGIAMDQGWDVRERDEYQRLPDLRLGSSFDFEIKNAATNGMIGWLLEIKNVDGLAFRDGWIENAAGNIEAPVHIELQVQHQMLVSGLLTTYLGALVGGNSVTLLRREADPIVHAAIMKRAAAFWKSIDANEPPPPDFAADLATIQRLNDYAEPGKILDASTNARIHALVAEYKRAGDAEKNAKELKGAAKAELLTLVGDAEKIIGPGFSISAGVLAPTVVESYTRDAYRDFRVFFKKPK